MEIVFSLEALPDVARQLLAEWKVPGPVAFYGQMGAGKTTFVHALCDVLQVSDTVGSPTFSIIHEYGAPSGTVYHIDCYRLKSEEEAVDAGVEECIYSGNWCFIEWPEKIPGLLPDNTYRVYLAPTDQQHRMLKYNSGY